MSAPDDMSELELEPAPLTEMMLAMDVCDTVRRDPSLADDLPRLAALYQGQGLAVPDPVLAEGVDAYRQNRFAYVPPASGWHLKLASLYVERRHWLPAARSIALMLLIGLGGYFFVYRPLHNSQLEQARTDLAQTMPAEMDALYSAIFNETKVQQAANDAAEMRERGKQAALAGDRAGAEAAIADLTDIRDTLRQDYRLMIVDSADSKWGFWTFPEDNKEATSYYLVVQALAADGTILSLPIRSEQTGKTETVPKWGIRVPETVYRAVEADKTDDGTDRARAGGAEASGFLDVDYVVQVLGGTVTRW